MAPGSEIDCWPDDSSRLGSAVSNTAMSSCSVVDAEADASDRESTNLSAEVINHLVKILTGDLDKTLVLSNL